MTQGFKTSFKTVFVIKTFYQLSAFKRVSTIADWWFVTQNVFFKSCIVHNLSSFRQNYQKCNRGLWIHGGLVLVETKFLVFAQTLGCRQPQCWFRRFHKSSENIFLFISWEGRKWRIDYGKAGCWSSDGCTTRRPATLC